MKTLWEYIILISLGILLMPLLLIRELLSFFNCELLSEKINNLIQKLINKTFNIKEEK